MSDTGRSGPRNEERAHAANGVLYTEYVPLCSDTPLGSLWRYESQGCDRDQATMATDADGNRKYWLERGDPLLNTVLPGTGISVVINCGDDWSAGATPVTCERLPSVMVFGPLSRSRMLVVGPRSTQSGQHSTRRSVAHCLVWIPRT